MMMWYNRWLSLLILALVEEGRTCRNHDGGRRSTSSTTTGTVLLTIVVLWRMTECSGGNVRSESR